HPMKGHSGQEFEVENMTNYRSRFRVALAANAVLLVILALAMGEWWHVRSRANPTPVQSPATAPASFASDLSAPTNAQEPAGPALGPVQLSPQRLQSIGVKFGEVENR